MIQNNEQQLINAGETFMNPNIKAQVLTNRVEKIEMTTSSKMDGKKTEIIINMEMANKLAKSRGGQEQYNIE